MPSKWLGRKKRLTPIRVILRKDSCSADISHTAWGKLLESAKSHLSSTEGHQQCSVSGLLVVCDDHRTAPGVPWFSQLRKQLELGNLLIDEPFGRDSKRNQFLQLCDLLAHLTSQSIEPNALFRQSHAQSMLKRTERLFHERGITIDLNKEEGGASAPP